MYAECVLEDGEMLQEEDKKAQGSLGSWQSTELPQNQCVKLGPFVPIKIQ